MAQLNRNYDCLTEATERISAETNELMNRLLSTAAPNAETDRAVMDHLMKIADEVNTAARNLPNQQKSAPIYPPATPPQLRS